MQDFRWTFHTKSGLTLKFSAAPALFVALEPFQYETFRKPLVKHGEALALGNLGCIISWFILYIYI